MRNRKIRNPEDVFASLVDRAEHGERFSEEELLDAGVTGENLPYIQHRIREHELELAAKTVRRLLLCLGNSPAAVALRIAILGDDGESVSGSANKMGKPRQNLHRSVERIKKRIERITG